MIISMFGQRYQPGCNVEELNELSDSVFHILKAIPGYISFHVYHADDGEDLAIVRFASREALEQWRNDPDHRATWRRAGEFFTTAWVQNVETYHEHTWTEDGSWPHEGDLSGFFAASSMDTVEFGA